LSSSFEEEEGIKVGEDGNGGLVDGGNDGPAMLGQPFHHAYDNGRRPGIEATGGF